jgi:hypothetical protein
MEVHVPAKIIAGGFIYRASALRKVGGNAVLKAFFADEAQQLLHLWNFNHARAAESFQWIIGETAFANIAAHLTFVVVSRKTGIAHCTSLYAAHTGAERIFFAHCSSDDSLEIHNDVIEKMFRQIRAMKADGLVRIVPIIVVLCDKDMIPIT